jgi:hypothetical protein
MTKSARRSPLAALFAALAVTAGGCTSETTTTTADAGTISVVSDAKLTVVSPKDGSCFPVPDGPDAMIPLTVEFTAGNSNLPANVYLRAAGFCSSIPNTVCGHLVVKVDGVENNQGATHTVNVLLRKFATPYHAFAITVELVGDSGETLLVARPDDAGAADLDAGITLQASLTVNAQKSCGTSSGAGGAPSTSSGGMGGGSSDAGLDGG